MDKPLSSIETVYIHLSTIKLLHHPILDIIVHACPECAEMMKSSLLLYVRVLTLC